MGTTEAGDRLDKATLLFAGVPLVERSTDRLRLVARRVAICGTRPDLESYAPVLPDLVEGAGPLAALVAALEDAGRHRADALAVVTAVDLPLLPWELLQWLVDRARIQASLATVPLVGERPQPLCAVYSARLAAPLRQQLVAGERKVLRAVEAACGRPQDFDLFDMAATMPSRRQALPVWFLNVNTPQEVAQAEELRQTLPGW